jgi:hypothetical protein
MIYSGPGFLEASYDLAPTPPSPLLSRQSSSSDTLEVGVREKAWSSINPLVLSGLHSTKEVLVHAGKKTADLRSPLIAFG